MIMTRSSRSSGIPCGATRSSVPLQRLQEHPIINHSQAHASQWTPNIAHIPWLKTTWTRSSSLLPVKHQRQPGWIQKAWPGSRVGVERKFETLKVPRLRSQRRPGRGCWAEAEWRMRMGFPIRSQLGCLGERRELPSRVHSRSPCWKRISVLSKITEMFVVNWCPVRVVC